MKKNRAILLASTLLALILISGSQIALAVGDASQKPLPGADVQASDLGNGIIPDCEPSNTNIGPGEPGCGLDDAIQVIYNIISYISYIIIPIAVLLLGYAGFTIMTSAGNSEKVTQAWKMIRVTAIGLAIIFLSTLIVRYIFKALDVNTQKFGPTNIEIK